MNKTSIIAFAFVASLGLAACGSTTDTADTNLNEAAADLNAAVEEVEADLNAALENANETVEAAENVAEAAANIQ